MRDLVEQLFVRGANRMLSARNRRPADGPGVLLGHAISETGEASTPVRLADEARNRHQAFLGKTGFGKSSLMRVEARDDIRRDRGFINIDLHGDTTPYLLSVIAAEETRRGMDLADRVILIDPSDSEWAVGLNVLQAASDAERFVQVAEVTELLKQRWDLTTLGARTEELVRNALFVLSAAHLTLVELAPLLTDGTFRQACLQHVQNDDVRAYFRERFDVASDAMQAVLRDAVLNKVSTFTADPHFRHILGQSRGGIEIVDALDHGKWVLLHLPKGRLGEQAATLGSLFLTHLKRSVFARQSRAPVTLYADEFQNLVSYTNGIDTLVAESRKMGVGLCSSNQLLAQIPQAIRAAVLSVGTHIFFQLTAQDAELANSLIGGGRALQQLLKELPARQAILKQGGRPWVRFRVLDVESATADTTDLLDRIHRRSSRRREDVEQEIQNRRRVHAAAAATAGDLDGWQ